MAKEKKVKRPEVGKPLTVDERRRRRRITLNVLVLLILAAGGAIGYAHVKAYVAQRLAFTPDAPRVVLKNRPVWMSDFLAEQIIASVQPSTARSSFDQQMLINTFEILKTNPWIKEVKQIRRAYGSKPGDTVELDCEYRAPIALVQWGDFYSLVDAESVRLPEQFTAAQLKKIMYGQDGRLNIRVIEGVKGWPPAPGKTWAGDDLAAGLEMAGLLYGKPYCEEILSVKVANHAGRVDPKDPWMVLVTKYGSEIRWGRPPNSKDAFIEVRWDRKLDFMRRIVENFHRIDAGHSAVDIRFDDLSYSDDDLHNPERSATLREAP